MSVVKSVHFDHDVIANAIWGCIHGLVLKSVLAESDVTIPKRGGRDPNNLEEHLQWGGKILERIRSSKMASSIVPRDRFHPRTSRSSSARLTAQRWR